MIGQILYGTTLYYMMGQILYGRWVDVCGAPGASYYMMGQNIIC